MTETWVVPRTLHGRPPGVTDRDCPVRLRTCVNRKRPTDRSRTALLTKFLRRRTSSRGIALEPVESIEPPRSPMFRKVYVPGQSPFGVGFPRTTSSFTTPRDWAVYHFPSRDRSNPP